PLVRLIRLSAEAIGETTQMRVSSAITSATPSPHRLASDAPAQHGPDWVKDAIFYQVFPDRFKNGDTSNDPAGTVPWGTPPQNDNFFEGGDLQGVQQGLSHIENLGANAIYMNPIFTSPSNHKYNTTDYDHVDPELGGDQAFTSLMTKVHADGMHLILDGVFNHTSNEHAWFKDVIAKGQASPYWSWYKVNRWPITTHVDSKGVLRSDDYVGWGAGMGGPYATLPVLDQTNPQVRDALFTGPNSVVRHWLRDGKIDGWRMDVADEIAPEVWRTARQVIKSENPNAYMVAESFHDASGMLKGDEFDGAMNYAYFQQPAVDFFAKKSINSDAFVNRLKNGYSQDAKLEMLNSLDSHDTPRFITQAGGDWYRARPAAIFQLTYQGAPSIYYGDEIGMEGGPDPDSRRAFDWTAANAADKAANAGTLASNVHATLDASGADKATQLTSLYEKLIATRKGSDALRRGDFNVLATHNMNDTLSYRRSVPGDNHDVLVALNNDTSGHDVVIPTQAFAPDGTKYTDALSGSSFTVQNGQITVPNLDGNWGAVLQRQV
ncbi:MAG: glycoside hydrolase family 13 protein, partial [Gaiellales bacterium]